MLSLQGLHPRKPPIPGQIRIIDPHGLLFSVGPPLLRRVKGSENSLVSRRYVYLTACVIHSSGGHLAPDTTPPPRGPDVTFHPNLESPERGLQVPEPTTFWLAVGLSQETQF